MRKRLNILWLVATIVAAGIYWPGKIIHAQSGHNITLTWSMPAAGGAPTSYNVKRSTASGAETQLASVPAPATTYIDNAGVGGTKYFYIVTAVNAGGESGPSNEATATFLVQTPGAPTSLAVTSN